MTRIYKLKSYYPYEVTLGYFSSYEIAEEAAKNFQDTSILTIELDPV